MWGFRWLDVLVRCVHWIWPGPTADTNKYGLRKRQNRRTAPASRYSLQLEPGVCEAVCGLCEHFGACRTLLFCLAHKFRLELFSVHWKRCEWICVQLWQLVSTVRTVKYHTTKRKPSERRQEKLKINAAIDIKVQINYSGCVCVHVCGAHTVYIDQALRIDFCSVRLYRCLCCR